LHQDEIQFGYTAFFSAGLLLFSAISALGRLKGRNGDKGIRTPDLLRAKQALSQLSYIPNEI
jgi:hypothetical protein